MTKFTATAIPTNLATDKMATETALGVKGYSTPETLRAYLQANGLSYALAKSAVAVPHTGNTSETTVATVTVPAGAIGPNGQIIIQALWSCSNNANNKTVRVRLGGIGGTAHYAAVIPSVAITSCLVRIANRNAADSQVSHAANSFGLNNSTSALVTGSLDTSASTTLVFTIENASAADTTTLESYIVDVVYGA